MADLVLVLAKFVLLGLLYLFLWRAVRVVSRDLAAAGRPAGPAPPARSSGAVGTTERRSPNELVIHPVSGAPHVVSLDVDRILLGRAPHVDVRLEDEFVSDEHAQVDRVGERWQVRDLGSTNGTFLNGARLTGPTLVSAGDVVRVGRTNMEVRR